VSTTNICYLITISLKTQHIDHTMILIVIVIVHLQLKQQKNWLLYNIYIEWTKV